MAELQTGNAVWKLLKALGAPEGCTEFHLIAKIDAPVMIDATFFADWETDDDGNPVAITERYYLARIENVVELDGPDDQQS